MKTFILVPFAVLILAKVANSELSPTMNVTLETAHYTCILGSNISAQPIKDCLYGIYAEDKQLDQYFQCMFRMYGLLDIQGNLKNETIYDAIHGLEKDQSYTEDAVSTCQDDKLYSNATQHEIAYEFFKCFRNRTEEAYYWSILKYLLNKQSGYTVLTSTQSLKLETVHYTCVMGGNVQLQPIKDSLNGIYSNNSDLIQYFQCVFRMYGYLDVKDNLKNETMLSSIPAEDKNRWNTEDAIKTCQYVEATEPNAIAYEFFKCFRNQTEDAEYWTTLKELSSKNDKQHATNVFVDFL